MSSFEAKVVKMSSDHELFMRRALDLAIRGQGSVSPNPMVGAVLVYKGSIISEGYHRVYGGPHAEVNALQVVNEPQTLQESTLYVTLEPCNHFGKTPPCTQLIIEKKIPHVVIACKDLNPIVSGKGIEVLKNSGIKVEVGILGEEAQELNKRFWINQLQQRPFIILKWAETQDGYLAGNQYEPIKISSPVTDRLSHKWRSEEDAILVGRHTVETDNPRLTNRFFFGKHPTVVVIDPHLRTNMQSNIYQTGRPVWIINHRKEITQGNCRYLMVADKQDFLLVAMQRLYKEAGIGSLIVEGGAHTLSKFIQTGLYDEFRVIKSANKIGQGIPAPTLPKGNFQRINWGDDEILFGKRL